DDWISQLPDEILVVVLSSLPLKEAARTSVLSTRWINLWKHTSCLDFEAESSLSERRKYVRWVNSVIRSYEGGSTLKHFRICFDLDRCSQKVITKWLEFAFARQVERLRLELLEYGDFEKVPSEVYAFPKHLLLVNNFKSLKALCLKSVDVTDEAIHFFIRNCQFLEQLIVHGALNITNLEVCGSSLGLKHLEISYCFRLKSVKVSAPNLTSLKVTTVQGLFLENVPMLVDVFVACGELYANKLAPALLSCIQQLEILTLWLNFPKEDIEQGKFPELPKLKKLVIRYN
ncbi:putative F-box/LRR-repeat protein at5g02700, partial [Phtheirospermum japonicum]